MTQVRPSQSMAAAKFRASYEVGRWHISLTKKRRGDWVWNSAKQEFERVGK